MSATSNPGYSYLYGPVPSRRLGRSLGIDIVPHKVCSYDCIYCQLGRTTRLTSERDRLVDPSEVIAELEHWLEEGGDAEYITFAGSGEPTLHSELGDMIRNTKKLTPIPVAVITNGSLLSEPEIREAVSAADLLVPSLDAGTERIFRAINRPAPGVSFLTMTEGLVRSAQEFAKEIWLEVMLVEGVNDSDSELLAIREIAHRVCPDRLQVNTVDRPSRSGRARPVSDDRLAEARRVFGASAEIIARGVVAATDQHQWRETDEQLMRMLAVRPCTVDDIIAASGRKAHEIAKHLRRLEQNGLIEHTADADPYYRCVTGG